MKTAAFCLTALVASATAFAPNSPARAFVSRTTSTGLFAKYNNMDEILALFPEDIPTLINFYDAATEDAIKGDVFRAKTLLKGRASVCSIKQQDYPELAKLWDCHEKTPSMILFKDGTPATRLYEQSEYLEIVAKVGQYCREAGEEHKEIS